MTVFHVELVISMWLAHLFGILEMSIFSLEEM